MSEAIRQIVEFIQKEFKEKPEAGIILGSGMAGLVNEMEISHSIDYSSIPNFLATSGSVVTRVA